MIMDQKIEQKWDINRNQGGEKLLKRLSKIFRGEGIEWGSQEVEQREFLVEASWCE